MKESATSSHIRLAAAKDGLDLWRNNCGAFEDENGRWVRYGLANDSAQINKEIKSSDLIGITPVVITEEMVGQTIGVFTAIETKPTGWTLKDYDQRGMAQQKFHDIVKKAGGFAGFASTVGEFRKIVGK